MSCKNCFFSRIGADGPQAPGLHGKSAYQAAVEAGYTGTEAQFSESLAGVADKITEAPTTGGPWARQARAWVAIAAAAGLSDPGWVNLNVSITTGVTVHKARIKNFGVFVILDMDITIPTGGGSFCVTNFNFKNNSDGGGTTAGFNSDNGNTFACAAYEETVLLRPITGTGRTYSQIIIPTVSM